MLSWPSGSAGPHLSSAASATGGDGHLPLLILSAPTATPSGTASIANTRQATTDEAPRAAALLGGSFGMALIAGLLAWRGRRLQAKPEPVGSDADGEAEAGIGGDELLPRFGVVPLDSVDKHEEQRILPPI